MEITQKAWAILGEFLYEQTNILAVVTARTARHYGKVHGFFNRSGGPQLVEKALFDKLRAPVSLLTQAPLLPPFLPPFA